MSNTPTKVTVTATHMVQSENPITLQDPFVLGPFDQLGPPGMPIDVVWVYECPGSVGLVPPERLHKAISRLLDYYPHLTGRLRVDPDTGVRSVTRIGAGMHLLEAYCDAPLRSFRNRSPISDGELSVFDLPGAGNELLAPWDMSLHGAQRDPMFTVQRTQFACSAVAIGIRLSHVVCSAGSFLGLYQDLAEIYRAIDSVSKGPIELASPPHLPPFMVTEMLHLDVDRQKEALAKQPATYSLRDDDAATQIQPQVQARFQQNSATDPIIGRSLRFSSKALAFLKGDAAGPDGSARISTFTALSAHLWQRTHLARLAQAESSSDEQVSIFSRPVFGTSVNFVPRLGLPRRSFGNTLLTPYVDLDSTKLAQAPLWEIAKIIHDLIWCIPIDEPRMIGKWIAAQPDKSRIKLNFPGPPTSFITSGWHHFPLYSGAELDVAPAFASPVFMDRMVDGIVFFVESKAKDGSIEAIASMRSSTWEYLDKDEHFITTWDRAK